METKKRECIGLDYLKEFACIGAKCEETCCAGWYIAVDEATYKKYQKVKEPVMRKRLDKELVAKRSLATPNHTAKIKLKNGRCAFLSKEGWCDIYTQLGEKYLSQTCALYPRTINKINDTLEYSLTFSCPEAARLLLLRKEPIKFEKLSEKSEGQTISATLTVNTHKPQKWQDYFFELRVFILEQLQNRKYSIEERLAFLKKAIEEIDYLVAQNTIKKIPKALATFKKKDINKASTKNLTAKEITLLIAGIKKISKDKKFPSTRYQECFEEMMSGLGIQEQDYTTYYNHFIKEKGHIIENYLVNYVVERCMPLDGKTPLESFEKMFLHYNLIKLHLIGISQYDKGLNEEKVVKLIQCFSRVFDHNEQYRAEMIHIYSNRGR